MLLCELRIENNKHPNFEWRGGGPNLSVSTILSLIVGTCKAKRCGLLVPFGPKLIIEVSHVHLKWGKVLYFVELAGVSFFLIFTKNDLFYVNNNFGLR